MLIPSIDLMAGKVVQLRQGRNKVIERDDPFALAREFSRFGEIAVIDLDAALSRGDNGSLVSRLCRSFECRVGGGIRSVEQARRLVGEGAAKIIIGSAVFVRGRIDRRFLEDVAGAVGRERVILALDNLRGRIVIDGWRTETGIEVLPLVPDLEPFASEFLFTRVEKEGLMGGTDLEAVRQLAAASSLPVTAAGGISTPAEIESLSALGANVQLGMAIYTGALSPAEAFTASVNWAKGGGLVPTVVQDESRRVLMLVWSSRESLSRTFETGQGWYFSRSRGRLWMKGETSGASQEFMAVRTDCDGDALLLTVRPAGPACHRGRYSCFAGKRFSFDDLYRVIRERIDSPPPGSYTASLAPDRLKAKILEEAAELVEARTAEEIAWEAADLVYFAWVLMARGGVTPDDVLAELGQRRRSRRRSDGKAEERVS